ncbi:MAG: class I SAM-dependent methyltransferase [Acutalibacteraceae bacterium]
MALRHFCRRHQPKANRALCAAVGELISPADDVLECACGHGLLTTVIAPRCKRLTATDFSAAMLRRAEKKCAKFGNVQLAQADILHLDYPDESFDAVVAANVIHLLDEPYRALQELEQVCRPGGRLIIPTYMNRTDNGSTTNRVSGAIGKAGADFKREFTPDTYRQFFAEAGYPDAEYTLCEGRIPCAVAVFRETGGIGMKVTELDERVIQDIGHGVRLLRLRRRNTLA